MSNTEKATSAGVILFRNTRGKREYLLLNSRADDWEFPKGSVEIDEELQQAAIRELEEETGIGEFWLIDGFSDVYEYTFTVGNKNIDKQVFLFIGETNRASVDLSHEHTDHQWRTYEEARRTVTHDGPKRILDDAEEFLRENYD